MILVDCIYDSITYLDHLNFQWMEKPPIPNLHYPKVTYKGPFPVSTTSFFFFFCFLNAHGLNFFSLDNFSYKLFLHFAPISLKLKRSDTLTIICITIYTTLYLCLSFSFLLYHLLYFKFKFIFPFSLLVIYFVVQV